MSIVDYFKKNNSPQSSGSVRYGQTSIESFFGAGNSVSEEEALKIPAVFSGIELISSAIGQLKFSLIKKDGETGKTDRKNDDPRLYLLNTQPNETIDAYSFKKALVKDFLLYGSSNIVIDRTLNKIKALHLLDTKDITVKVFVYDGYRKYSETTLNNVSGSKKFSDDQLLSILRDTNNGLTGKGLLKTNPDILKLALAEINYSKSILNNGAVPLGILKTNGKLSDKAFGNLKSSWSGLYTGTEKAGKTVILEEGLDYSPISMKPNDLQLSEVRKSYISDIARLLNIPEFMINADANKYGNSEEQSLGFIQFCLAPIVSTIESAVNKELLLEDEKLEGYEFKMDMSKLIQVTRKEKAEAVAAELTGGLISFREARSDLDRPQTEQADYFKLSLGSVLYKYKTDEMIIPNTMGSKASLEDSKDKSE